jgi:hypothetical protein
MPQAQRLTEPLWLAVGVLLALIFSGMDPIADHYDRIGHFAQGFIPAILAQLLLSRPHDRQLARLGYL